MPRKNKYIILEYIVHNSFGKTIKVYLGNNCPKCNKITVSENKNSIRNSLSKIKECRSCSHKGHTAWNKGEVVAVGDGKYDDGVLVPMNTKVGDEVLFQWGDKIKVDGVEYWIVSESNILAVVK
jgi:chaperonin GroES